jgi:molybdopterin molybdotransferase
VIGFEEAQRRIVVACAPLGTERVALADAAGRVAAQSLRAEADLVPFARSAMDGFAVRAADIAAGSVELPVAARSYAERGSVVHAPQTATAIATGAPIPRGADAVLPIEDVETSDGLIRVGRAVPAGSHVFPPGEDARAGDLLVEAGTHLRPSTLGLLAASGHASVEVYQRPRVALVSTGDERVDIGAMPEYGQIRNSNATVIAATLQGLGAQIVASETAGDSRALLRAALSRALEAADLVVTTGGASVGERDLVKPLLDELGVEFAFRSWALRPAKPSAFGVRGSVRVAVLPGNPSSAFVALQELARPALRALAGHAKPVPARCSARLEGRVRAKPGSTYACFAEVRVAGGALVARPLDNQCSALTRSASRADGLILMPPGSQTFTSGADVEVDVFDWSNVASVPG